MARHIGMYRRSELIRSAGRPTEAEWAIAARLLAARCAVGEHKQETDATTGNEVCRWCGAVLDDYPDCPVSTTPPT